MKKGSGAVEEDIDRIHPVLSKEYIRDEGRLLLQIYTDLFTV